MTLDLLKRADKGSALDANEHDTNFTNIETEVNNKVLTSDSRLTNSREWTANTISAAEAEAGTITTRRAFTALRVRQAIVAWWATISSTIATLTGAETLTNKTLGNIAETIFTISDTAGFEVDPANGPTQIIVLGANRTPAATNFADGQVVTLLIDDGTGFAITWTTMAVTWLGGVEPTLETSGYTAVLLFKIAGVIHGKA